MALAEADLERTNLLSARNLAGFRYWNFAQIRRAEFEYD
jgi:hypothetical protein